MCHYLSRAKESKGLSLVGFSKARLIPPPQKKESCCWLLLEIGGGDEIVLSGLCCNNAIILNEVLERPKDTEDVTCSLEYIGAKDDELTETGDSFTSHVTEITEKGCQQSDRVSSCISTCETGQVKWSHRLYKDCYRVSPLVSFLLSLFSYRDHQIETQDHLPRRSRVNS